jgi:para-nitrobenzyl esterase
MRIPVILAAAALLLPTATFAQAAAPPAPTAAPAPAARSYSTAETDIGTILDDPAAKAVVGKYLLATIANPQIEMARSLTLKALQQYSPDTITDEVLAKIDADFAKLPPKK